MAHGSVSERVRRDGPIIVGHEPITIEGGIHP
jgi:hypothetical protein